MPTEVVLKDQPTEGGLGHGAEAPGQRCQLRAMASDSSACTNRDPTGAPRRNVPTAARTLGAAALLGCFYCLFICVRFSSLSYRHDTEERVFVLRLPAAA